MYEVREATVYTVGPSIRNQGCGSGCINPDPDPSFEIKKNVSGSDLREKTGSGSDLRKKPESGSGSNLNKTTDPGSTLGKKWIRILTNF